jgi:hypothetical protein
MEQIGQIVDLSQFKNKKPKPEPEVEVKTITQEMMDNNPMIKRAIELQTEDDAKVYPITSIIMAILNVFLDNSYLKQFNPDELKVKVDEKGEPVLVDGEPVVDRDEAGNLLPAGNPRQQFIAGIVEDLEKIIDSDNTVNRDVKYGYVVLAKCMNLLSRLFYSDHNEYLSDLHKAYEIAVRDAINPIINNNQGITTRMFYSIPGSIIEYVAWNDNLDKAALEQMAAEKAQQDKANSEQETETTPVESDKSQ